MSNPNHGPVVTAHGAAGENSHSVGGRNDDQGHGDHGHDEHHDEHHGGLRIYIYVFVALCVLTTASFFTYSSAWPWKNTPQVGWAFMMAVSCTKAMLVILFFMHVKYEANWKYVLTIPAGMMSIFLMLMLVPDVGMRTRWYSEERQSFVGTPKDKDELLGIAPGSAGSHAASSAKAGH